MENNLLEVKIRFNTDYPIKSDFKWRLLVNGLEFLVDEIDINCSCFTSKDIIKTYDGRDVEKYHISCNAKNISFEDNKKAIIT